MLCLLFTGFSVTPQQTEKFNNILSTIKPGAVEDAQYDYNIAYQKYYNSKGWFSCDATCTLNKYEMESAKTIWELEEKNMQATLSDAKSTMGIFSAYGVEETREKFWQMFNKGNLWILT